MALLSHGMVPQYQSCPLYKDRMNGQATVCISNGVIFRVKIIDKLF